MKQVFHRRAMFTLSDKIQLLVNPDFFFFKHIEIIIRKSFRSFFVGCVSV